MLQTLASGNAFARSFRGMFGPVPNCHARESSAPSVGALTVSELLCGPVAEHEPERRGATSLALDAIELSDHQRVETHADCHEHLVRHLAVPAPELAQLLDRDLPPKLSFHPHPELIVLFAGTPPANRPAARLAVGAGGGADSAAHLST